MPRKGIPLQEKARLANISGDIRYGQWWDRQKDISEGRSGKLVDKGQEAMSGDYKGEKVLETFKFLSNFFGPAGKAVNVGLSLIDMIADKKKADKEIKAFKKLRPSGEGLYGDYELQNFDAVLSQLEQKQKSSVKQSILSNLLSIGGKSGLTKSITDKLDKSGLAKETLGRMFPQMGLQDIKMPNIFGGKSTDIISSEEPPMVDPFWEKVYENKGEVYSPPYMEEWKESQKEGVKGPQSSQSLYDYFEFLQPQFQRMFRGKGEGTYPAAPYKQRASIRRRII